MIFIVCSPRAPFDEAHHLKNRATRNYQLVNRLIRFQQYPQAGGGHEHGAG